MRNRIKAAAPRRNGEAWRRFLSAWRLPRDRQAAAAAATRRDAV